MRVRAFSQLLQAPELLADGVPREGVLLDLDCPNAAVVLLKVIYLHQHVSRLTYTGCVYRYYRINIVRSHELDFDK